MNSRRLFSATLFLSVAIHAGLFAAPWSKNGDNGFQDRYEIRFESGEAPAPERVKQRPVQKETAPLAQEKNVPEEIETTEALHQPDTLTRSVPQEKLDEGQRKQSEESRRSGQGEVSRLDEYLSRIKASVEFNKFYPPVAKQLKLQGTVIVRVSLSPAGGIAGISVLVSSGHQSIDRAAEKAVRSSAPFDPPTRFGLSEITLDIPVIYKLT